MGSTTLARLIQALGLSAFAKRFKRRLVSAGVWPRQGFRHGHRKRAYKQLTGRGLEIGALHFPAIVPPHCTVEYCDANSREQSEKIFPELDSSLLVDVDYIVNLDEDKLSAKVMPPYDFVIMNHVIEHVANPVSVLESLFSIVRPGGLLVIAAPDKEFTFDKPRGLTPFSHLLEEYENGVSSVDDDHYLDFIRHAEPGIFNSGNAELLASTLKFVRDRREHAHVWDSETFLAFLQESMDYLGIDAKFEYVSKAATNHAECFVLLRKA